jgi:methylenetetrahydrofolate reductase (NADPH)
MRIDELIATSDEPIFSFEFFPPKDEEGEFNLFAALYALRSLKPSFVSVTWGAGGSTRAKTIDLTRRIREQVGLEAMAHLTTVGASVDELHEALGEMAEVGVENVLVLRGDPPKGQSEYVAAEGGLSYASELATLVADRYDFCIVGACYPEVHPECTDLAADLEHLRKKVDAGAKVLISQLFFDNSIYERFVEEARGAGIDVPIIPGIMPVTNVDQIKRFTSMCGASLPDSFRSALESRAGQPEAVLELGVAYATLQCAELLERGAPGIHFYTLNKSPATRAILSALRLMHPWKRTRVYA